MTGEYPSVAGLFRIVKSLGRYYYYNYQKSDVKWNINEAGILLIP